MADEKLKVWTRIGAIKRKNFPKYYILIRKFELVHQFKISTALIPHL